MLGAFVNTFSLFYEAVLPRKKRYLPPADINSLIKRADAICFDVDSTVINDEGIVSLANVCGVGNEVEKMYANIINVILYIHHVLYVVLIAQCPVESASNRHSI